MNPKHFYHAYLAALGIRFQDVPAEIKVFDAKVHLSWENVKTCWIKHAFKHSPPVEPAVGTIQHALYYCAKQDAPDYHVIQEFWRLLTLPNLDAKPKLATQPKPRLQIKPLAASKQPFKFLKDSLSFLATRL